MKRCRQAKENGYIYNKENDAKNFCQQQRNDKKTKAITTRNSL